MPESIQPGPVCDTVGIREAVCIHTRKIFDSCRDQDCIEDLRVYPTTSSQAILDRAVSVKARRAELLRACLSVEPVSFNRGFYAVDVRYFYRITADAFVGAARPMEVVGLAVFDKRVILFGSEGCVKSFRSDVPCCSFNEDALKCDALPTAVAEAVDPIILHIKLADHCQPCGCECECTGIPAGITDAFGCELAFSHQGKRLYVTLGQFSIIRLERDTQLLIPAYDYCMPQKECDCGGTPCVEDPCEAFRKVQFPVDQFFPPDHAPRKESKQGNCSC